LSTRKYPNVINVFLVLTIVRVEVECGRVSHITPGFVRYYGDIVADLALVRITLRRIKRVAHSDIGRPSDAGIGAVGVEQL
jgi:hypothetical protein